jgi:hypothetical protein
MFIYVNSIRQGKKDVKLDQVELINMAPPSRDSGFSAANQGVRKGSKKVA